jgi:hypothetical protein
MMLMQVTLSVVVPLDILEQNVKHILGVILSHYNVWMVEHAILLLVIVDVQQDMKAKHAKLVIFQINTFIIIFQNFLLKSKVVH